MSGKETVPVATRITKEMYKQIGKVVANDSRYINFADYLRDLIRKDMESRSK